MGAEQKAELTPDQKGYIPLLGIYFILKDMAKGRPTVVDGGLGGKDTWKAMLTQAIPLAILLIAINEHF